MTSYYQDNLDGHEIRKIGDKWYIITDECLTLGPYESEQEAQDYARLAAPLGMLE